MRYPTIGAKVRALHVPDDNTKYITQGNLYDVVGTPGTDWSFAIVGDQGQYLYCLFPRCCHATWEIAE